MNTTRNGKIARLPKSVREQLNRRLADGEAGPKRVAWLNRLPEVPAVVAAEFAGCAVREQNLSQWRRGGYEDWVGQQEALDWTRSVAEQAGELAGAPGHGAVSDHISTILVVRLGRRLQELAAAAEDGETGDAPEKRLVALCQELAKIRHGDHEVEWLRLERDKLELANVAFELKQEHQDFDAAQACREIYPEIKAIMADHSLDQTAQINEIRRRMFGSAPK